MQRRSLLLGILLLSLTSCSGSQGSEDLSGQLKPAAPVESLTARMALRVLHEDGSQQKIGMVVLNPEEVPIQSVRAWVQYDTEQLEVRDLTVEDGRFILFAPGERMIDPERGLLKLGTAVSHSLRDREILVASFVVQRKGRVEGEKPVINFYDWRAEGEGHTAVLSVQNGVARNILQHPLSLAL